MKILEVLFFLFSVFSIVHAGKENVCPISYCGSLTLDYPFKLPSLEPQNGCTYMNLSCKDTLGTTGTPILNLPYAGDFYVRYIAYYDSSIELYDPGNCLMRRLMNLNLSSSPFKAIAYENYTFYTCPSSADLIGPYVLPIDCLSNSTNSTVATALISSDLMLEYGCRVIGSWLLPVSRPHQFEFEGMNGDLYLEWNSNTCKACAESDHQVGYKGNQFLLSGLVFTHFRRILIIIYSIIIIIQ